jgi:hypothetical protein
MSQYQSRDREDSEPIAELQWLEDSVDHLVDTAAACVVTIVSGMFQLLSGRDQKR